MIGERLRNRLFDALILVLILAIGAILGQYMLALAISSRSGQIGGPCYGNQTCDSGLVCYRLTNYDICEPTATPAQGLRKE